MTAERGNGLAALPVLCVAEDRQACEPSLRLLLASLHEHCSPVRVELFHPDPTPEFRTWVSRYPSVAFNDHRVPGGWRKYDVKPQALLTLLDRGHEEVIWIDSDILICRDFRPLFSGLAPDVMVVTEEALCSTHQDPDGLRARLWNLPVGRSLPFTANSSVMRVTAAHRRVLTRWRALLDDRRYREAQGQHWRTRPPHLLGDQDVLTAVLASEEFADVPLTFLRRGRDILQCFGPYGYTIRERLYNIRHGMPPFVHSQGNKPWWPVPQAPPGNPYLLFNALYLELLPYTLLARHYRQVLTNAEWVEPGSRVVSILRGLGCSYPPLTGLPLALVADLVRPAKRVWTRLSEATRKSTRRKTKSLATQE